MKKLNFCRQEERGRALQEEQVMSTGAENDWAMSVFCFAEGENLG